MVTTMLIAVVGGALTARRRAATAADLAALAGAAAWQRGDDACRTARAVALANRARVTGCSRADEDVLVVVVVDGPRWAAHRLDVRARARAGPHPP